MSATRGGRAQITVSWEEVRAAAAESGVDEPHAAALFARLEEDLAGPLSTQRIPLDEQSTLARTVQTLIFAGAALLMGAHGFWVRDSYASDGWNAALPLLAGMLIAILIAAEIALRRRADALAAVLGVAAVLYATAVTYAALSAAGYGLTLELSEDWPWNGRDWLPLEVAAIVVASLVWLRIRRPFVSFPAWIGLVFLAVDLGTRVLGTGRARAVETCLVGGALLAVAIALDYRGLRRNAFWPHLAGILAVLWGSGGVLDDYRAGAILCGIALMLLGVWLARSWHLAVGALLVYGPVASLDPSFGTLLVSGALPVGIGIWLGTSRSALRRWLATRVLPAPQVD